MLNYVFIETDFVHEEIIINWGSVNVMSMIDGVFALQVKVFQLSFFSCFTNKFYEKGIMKYTGFYDTANKDIKLTGVTVSN